jgi:hypothetical protein
MDATMAWLESLAAKQGADQETLVTRPEDRQVETPDWVQNITAQDSSPASEPADETEQPPVEISGWQTEDNAQAGEATTPVPDWFEVSMEEETQIDQGVPANVDHTPAEWIPEISESTLEPVEPLSDLPAWLQQVEADEKQAASEPESEPKASLEDWLHSLERESTAPPALYSEETEPVLSADSWQAPGESQAPADIDPSLTGQDALFAAQNALNRGRLDPALETYNRFITNGEFLDEVIHDLRDALYRYPVDISVWQAIREDRSVERTFVWSNPTACSAD